MSDISHSAAAADEIRIQPIRRGTGPAGRRNFSIRVIQGHLTPVMDQILRQHAWLHSR